MGISMRKWLVVEVQDGEPDWSEATEIHLFDPGYAAEEYAEQINEDGPHRSRRIAVKPSNGGETRIFDVEPETMVSYRAFEVD